MATYAYTFTSGDTVTPTKLNNARTVSEIVDADVSATAAIAMSKLATGALPAAITVATANIVDANVTTAKINDAAVTFAKQQSPQYTGFRNKIINGKMEIAQRGTSFAAIGNGLPTLDQFLWNTGGSGVVTISQQSDVPTGDEFQNSLRVAVTTADTNIISTDLYALYLQIEGYNARDLIGRTFTLSFWVRSTKTGTHCVEFANTGANRCYVATYTVNVSDTWEQKSITVSGGLITAGTWNWTNGVGLLVRFILAVGSARHTTAGAWQTGDFWGTSAQVNCLDSTSNIFAITGAQLEVGSVATPFEHRPFGAELALCQRYYEKSYAVHTAGSANTVYFKALKRAAPNVSVTTVGGNTVSVSGGSYTNIDAFRATSASSGDFTWTASAEFS
jgi:hypothetical protein